MLISVFFSSRRRHTRCALVTGVQTCALPICQAVYLHSGLIRAADNVEQVQGVVAHELGHITGGHAVRFSEGMAAATGITIMSLLLGAAAAAAEIGRASCRERGCQYV